MIAPAVIHQPESGFGFIHSHVEGLPIWWSLNSNRILTGWAGGPAAAALVHRSKGSVCETALRSLSEIFGTPKHALRRALRDFATHNWSRDPFSRGAYTFTGVGLDGAAARLRTPWRTPCFSPGKPRLTATRSARCMEPWRADCAPPGKCRELSRAGARMLRKLVGGAARLRSDAREAGVDGGYRANAPSTASPSNL